MFFAPERLAIAGALVYLALWILAPLNAVSPLSFPALLYIVLCYGAFLAGCNVAAGASSTAANPTKTSPPVKNSTYWLWFAVLMVLGVAGIMLRLYDKFVLRDALVVGSAIETREALADTAAGPLSAVGGVLYPFCYLPLFMLWIRERGGLKSNMLIKWVAIGVALLPALEALMLLSRSQMLVAFGMMYFGVSCALYRGEALPRKLVIPVVGGMTILIGVTVAVFLARLDEMELQLLDSLLTSAYGELLVPNELATEIVSGGNSIFSIALANVIPILQYYLHGLYEFCLLWERPNTQIFSYGTEHFFPYVKLLSIANIVDKSLIAQDLYYREGVFTMFFGPLWIDFWWFGILAIFILGFLAKRVAILAKDKTPSALPLHSFLCVVIFFIPVVNLIVSAQGMYTVNAFVFFFFAMRKVVR